MWAMVADMAAVSADGGYDVATGRLVLGPAAAHPRVIAAYRRAEQQRAHRLAELMTARAVPQVTVTGRADIRRSVVDLTRVSR